MIQSIKHLVEAEPFDHFIVAVIVLVGLVAGLETSPAIMAQRGGMLLALAWAR